MEEGQEDGPIREERRETEGWKADKQITEGLKAWLKGEGDSKSHLSGIGRNQFEYDQFNKYFRWNAGAMLAFYFRWGNKITND